MPYIVYLDETGDHGMEVIHSDYPVFGVTLIIVDITEYYTRIVPEFYRLKLEIWGHEGVILHSRDIRRKQGDFSFLVDQAQQLDFYTRINAVMSSLPYQVITAIIHKERHYQVYGRWADNPYDLALSFALEILYDLLVDHHQQSVQIIAEARGTNEDNALRLSFLNTITNGTGDISGDQFKQISFHLTFLSKARNIIGTQMADLIAYPTARHVINPDGANPAYTLVKDKFYQRNNHNYGLKVFPPPANNR